MIIRGRVGSRGKVTGIARVIIRLEDFDKFNQGEILVTEATSPAWTPLIHASSAVVTDIGGVLSHAAIVSREYGIPAVVGTKYATRKIKDGDKILIDGTKGIVTVL